MFINPKIKIIDRSSLESKESVNFFCQICHFPLISMQDFEKNKSHKCCLECYMQFAQSRQEEWKKGYRPNQTEIKEYIYLRKKIYNKT